MKSPATPKRTICFVAHTGNLGLIPNQFDLIEIEEH
jgi:hypothetical protein